MTNDDCCSDENHEARNAYTEITRRYHELEIELRRLENEREELTAAYKEAEAVRIHCAHLHTIGNCLSEFELLIRDDNRAARLRSSARSVWHPSTVSSVTTPNGVCSRRTRKSNRSGE